MSRSRWLRLDTETRCSTAARRKFRVRATGEEGFEDWAEIKIGHCSITEQFVHIVYLMV